MLRNLLNRVGVKAVGAGSRRVKQLTCMLEYTDSNTADQSHDDVTRIREFKQKYGLTDSQFIGLSNILGTDYNTLRYLGGDRIQLLVERKLREFGVYARGDIEGNPPNNNRIY